LEGEESNMTVEGRTSWGNPDLQKGGSNRQRFILQSCKCILRKHVK